MKIIKKKEVEREKNLENLGNCIWIRNRNFFFIFILILFFLFQKWMEEYFFCLQTDDAFILSSIVWNSNFSLVISTGGVISTSMSNKMSWILFFFFFWALDFSAVSIKETDKKKWMN